MIDTRSTTPHLEEYYAKRAREYEQVYEKPERQRELAWLRERIPKLFARRTVLEVRGRARGIAHGRGLGRAVVLPGGTRRLARASCDSRR